MVDVVRLTVPQVPLNANRLMRMHHFVRSKWLQDWCLWLGSSAGQGRRCKAEAMGEGPQSPEGGDPR
jgi:hypothetical protein